MGFYLDVFVEYLIRVVARGIQLLRSRKWPFTLGLVTGSDLRPSGLGCCVVTLKYEYLVDSKIYNGTFKKPFIWTDSGKTFAAAHQQNSRFGIRVKPDEPAVSVHRD
jgi:hypothetical protein